MSPYVFIVPNNWIQKFLEFVAIVDWANFDDTVKSNTACEWLLWEHNHIYAPELLQHPAVYAQLIEAANEEKEKEKENS